MFVYNLPYPQIFSIPSNAFALNNPISSIINVSHFSILSLVAAYKEFVNILAMRVSMERCPSPYPLQLLIVIAFLNCNLAMPVVAVMLTLYVFCNTCLMHLKSQVNFL